MKTGEINHFAQVPTEVWEGFNLHTKVDSCLEFRNPFRLSYEELVEVGVDHEMQLNMCVDTIWDVLRTWRRTTGKKDQMEKTEGMKFDDGKPQVWLLPYSPLKEQCHPDCHRALGFFCAVARGSNLRYILKKEHLLNVCEVLQFGANKYAAFNWENGINFTRIISAGIRHALAAGKYSCTELDPETGIAHFYHMNCNVIFLNHYLSALDVYKAYDDRADMGGQE